MGSSLNSDAFLGVLFYKGAVLYWVPQTGALI